MSVYYPFSREALRKITGSQVEIPPLPHLWFSTCLCLWVTRESRNIRWAFKVMKTKSEASYYQNVLLTIKGVNFWYNTFWIAIKAGSSYTILSDHPERQFELSKIVLPQQIIVNRWIMINFKEQKFNDFNVHIWNIKNSSPITKS